MNPCQSCGMALNGQEERFGQSVCAACFMAEVISAEESEADRIAELTRQRDEAVDVVKRLRWHLENNPRGWEHCSEDQDALDRFLQQYEEKQP